MPRNRSKPSNERSVAFVGQTAGVVDSITVVHDEATGEMRIEELDPTSLRIEHFYKRASGKEKILLSAPALASDIRFSYLSSIRKNCDYLVAVDTNTRSIGNSRVSVTFAYMTPLLKQHTGDIPFSPLAAYVVLNVSADTNPERIGWHLIVQNHLAPAHAVARLRVGLIVDSELGAIPRINQGAEPYYAASRLPAYARLIYASDASADTLPSQMIRYCDTCAEKALDDIARKSGSVNFSRNGDQNFHSYARLVFRTEGLE